MEIGRLHGINKCEPDKNVIHNISDNDHEKDSVSIGVSPHFASINSSSIPDNIFNKKNVIWSCDAYKSTNVSKGIMESSNGNLIAGTYCDLRQIDHTDGHILWEKDFMKPNPRNLSTSPAVMAQDNSILIGTTDGYLYSLDPLTGNENWKYNTGSYDTNPLQGPDGTIYVQKNKDIEALNQDGTEKFRIPVNCDRLTINYVDPKGSIYAKGGFNEIIAINSDGKIKWRTDGSHITGFQDAPGHLFITTTKSVPHPQYKNSTTIHTLVSARDPKTGGKFWENEYDYARVEGYKNDLLLVYEHNKISALDPSTGKPIWENKEDSMRNIKTILPDGSIILSTHGQFQALDGKTGKTKWVFNSETASISSDVYFTNRGDVVVRDENNICCINPSNGMLNQIIKTGINISKITISKDESTIYAEEIQSGTVHAIDFRSQKEIAKEIIEDIKDLPENHKDIDVSDDYIIIDGIKIPVKNN